MSKLLIKISALSKKISKTNSEVLNKISFSINEGESFSLLGEPGCGKISLLRIIAGLEESNEGKIIVDGQDITNMPAHLRPVSIIFKSYALFPNMNIYDNVLFGLKGENIKKELAQEKVKEVLTMLGMLVYSKRKPDQISDIQQQRIALARSLVKNPKILILEDPLSNFDKKTKEIAKIELRRILNMLNIAFIIVTDNEDEAMAMSDRVAIIKDGSILQIGSPDEIYKTPNNLYIANLIGSINILEVFILSNEFGTAILEIKEAGIDMISNDADIRHGSNCRAYLAIRPEKISISSKEKYNIKQIMGSIIDISYLGNRIIYYLQLKSSKIIQISVDLSTENMDKRLTYNKTAYISWNRNAGIILKAL